MTNAAYWRRKAKHLTANYNRFHDWFLSWTGRALEVLPPPEIRAMLRRAQQKASRPFEQPAGPVRYFRGGEVRLDIPVAWVGAKSRPTCFGDRKNVSGHGEEHVYGAHFNEHYVPPAKEEAAPTTKTTEAIDAPNSQS